MPEGTSGLDVAEIAGTDSRDVRFRVVEPGPITIHSVPSGHPTHSDSGVLGWLLLLRPGQGSGREDTAKLTDGFMGLTYNATAADVALAGAWTCVLNNGADIPLKWQTSISGHVAANAPPPVSTASFDVELLNAMVAEVVTAADFRVHLQSSADGSELSALSWSPGLGFGSGYVFHIDDASKHIDIIDADIVWRIGDGLDPSHTGVS